MEELNQSGQLKDDDILVTVDVCSLYTNLDMTEGLEACREALEDRNDKKVPTDFIIKLLEIILKYNIFEFNEEMFIQMIGTAMGAVPAVSYANITMAKVIDPKLLEAAENFKTNDVFPIIFMKRFLDDIKMVWRGSVEKLHAFLDAINQIHPSLKFTLSHTTSKYPGDSCECPAATSIPFLDTSCSIVNGIIKTDLYKKETDRNQHLLLPPCPCDVKYILLSRPQNCPYLFRS